MPTYTDDQIRAAIQEARNQAPDATYEQLKSIALGTYGIPLDQWNRATAFSDDQIRNAFMTEWNNNPSAGVEHILARGRDHYGLTEEQITRALNGIDMTKPPTPTPAPPPPPTPAPTGPTPSAPPGPPVPPPTPAPTMPPAPIPTPPPTMPPAPGTGPISPVPQAPANYNPNEGALSQILKQTGAWNTPLTDRLYDRRLISGWSNPGAPTTQQAFAPADIQNPVGALTQLAKK